MVWGRLNDRGTEAEVGNINPGTQTSVMAQWRAGLAGDLLYANVWGEGNRRLPAVVNTRHGEYHPTIWGRWVLFTRRNVDTGRHRVMLFNRDTKGLRTLAADHDGRTVDAGQVTGDYVTWWWSGPAQSNVVRYRISTRDASPLPKPRGYARQHYSAIDREGTVYYQRRTGRTCGASPQLVRKPLTGPAEILYTYPAGKDGTRVTIQPDAGYEYDLTFVMRTCAAPSSRQDDTYRAFVRE